MWGFFVYLYNMKSTIKKILKESAKEKFVTYVIEQIKKDLKTKDFYHILTSIDYKSKFGVGNQILEDIWFNVEKKLENIKDTNIDPLFVDNVNVGNYNIEFKINYYSHGTSPWRHEQYTWFRFNVDLSGDLYDEDINYALSDPDYGAEVRNEVKDIILETIFNLIPELFMLNDLNFDSSWEVDF